MALITEDKIPQFNLEEIQVRDFVRAQYHTWDEPRNGIVTRATPSCLFVIFLPLIHLATRYYVITAQEVAEGKWRVLYSRDMQEIKEAGEPVGNG